MTLNLEYHLVDLKPQEMARDRITKKWEVFAGRNRFYCDGRLMTAPNGGVFLLTVFLITGTCTLFFIYDCHYLAENVTIAIPIIGGLLFIFTMSSLLRTSLSDPGIIPRATPEEAAYVEKQIEVTNSANSPTYRPPPRTKEVLIKGHTVKLKYCFTCKIFRPPRASHCSLCDNCVDRFDHHCPWVGNCVGRRNYRFFYMFIVSLAFLAVFIFACAIAHLILITKNEGQFLDAVKQSPPSVIVATICFFSVWSILGLAGFHTYLTTSNQTTNEDIKGSFASKRGQENMNPYSQGNVCLNCFYILCGPVTPSLLDRRGIVTDDYRAEISRNVMPEINQPMKNFGIPVQNGPSQVTLNASEMPGIYRQTTETTDSNAGSVTHLVSNEQPLAIAPALQKSSEHQYMSQTSLNQAPVYSNILSHGQVTLSKSQSYANNLNVTDKSDVGDLHLDPVVLRDTSAEKRKDDKLDNDMTLQEKENSLLSASRLRLLQDTTMIESALDLDSLDDSSLGTNSQAGLMKVVV
ncbi:palmitoyltransferase app [Tribolium castaneum]|nr:PREDICTED: palmitoyltransferase ZDHHC18 [Tribolium castaneum]|eukprot:XP_966647.3 PREDICTED: palmitoyltransferase ZDHHC18 [Tribolium castaneum]